MRICLDFFPKLHFFKDMFGGIHEETFVEIPRRIYWEISWKISGEIPQEEFLRKFSTKYMYKYDIM